jgi:hypothetical protein
MAPFFKHPGFRLFIFLILIENIQKVYGLIINYKIETLNFNTALIIYRLTIITLSLFYFKRSEKLI